MQSRTAQSAPPSLVHPGKFLLLEEEQSSPCKEESLLSKLNPVTSSISTGHHTGHHTGQTVGHTGHHRGHHLDGLYESMTKNLELLKSAAGNHFTDVLNENTPGERMLCETPAECNQSAEGAHSSGLYSEPKPVSGCHSTETQNFLKTSSLQNSAPCTAYSTNVSYYTSRYSATPKHTVQDRLPRTAGDTSPTRALSHHHTPSDRNGGLYQEETCPLTPRHSKLTSHPSLVNSLLSENMPNKCRKEFPLMSCQHNSPTGSILQCLTSTPADVTHTNSPLCYTPGQQVTVALGKSTETPCAHTFTPTDSKSPSQNAQDQPKYFICSEQEEEMTRRDEAVLRNSTGTGHGFDTQELLDPLSSFMMLRNVLKTSERTTGKR